MKINTSRFGEIEISDNSLFKFTVPILGFESEDLLALIEHDEKSNFKWLQSVKTPELAFAVTVADFFGIDYSFEVSDDVQEKLGIESADDLITLNVVVIPQNNPSRTTINLAAPILMNIKNHKAGQIILPGNNFAVDHLLFGGK